MFELVVIWLLNFDMLRILCKSKCRAFFLGQLVNFMVEVMTVSVPFAIVRVILAITYARP